MDDASFLLRELKQLTAALAEKENALVEMEAVLAEKDAALAQKIDEVKQLQKHASLHEQDAEICVTINSASDLKDVHAKLAEKLHEAAEHPGQLKFMIKVMRVDERRPSWSKTVTAPNMSTSALSPASSALSPALEKAFSAPDMSTSTLQEEEEEEDDDALTKDLTDAELAKVKNLMTRFGGNRQSCVAALKHYAWHAGKAAQHLKKKDDGVEETEGIAGKSQSDLVMYSIEADDLQFAASDPSAKSELLALKAHLKTAGSPLEVVDVSEFVAQGTAGWVFLAAWKSTGQRHAMKVIRMTQVRTGLREWYVSKLLRRAGISNVVLTDEEVHVLHKKSASKIVSKQLEFAGPVPYYACFHQEFMGGGTLEALSQNGMLTPALLLQSLATVSQTLAAMHKNKVQHRDVKPENVLLEMQDGELDGELGVAKLCDLGSAELGTDPKGKAEDVRRFGVTVFAAATGEPWTKNQLIRAKHEDLIHRITVAAVDFPSGPMKRLPEAVRELLEDSPSMARAAQLMAELHRSL